MEGGLSSVTFSKSTLEVFAELLGGYSLPANHPDFTRVASAIAVAKDELAKAIAEDQPKENDTPAPKRAQL